MHYEAVRGRCFIKMTEWCMFKQMHLHVLMTISTQMQARIDKIDKLIQEGYTLKKPLMGSSILRTRPEKMCKFLVVCLKNLQLDSLGLHFSSRPLYVLKSESGLISMSPEHAGS